MPRRQFSLKTIFAATAAVAVLCWAATINPLFAVLLVYAGIGASLAVGQRESRHIK